MEESFKIDNKLSKLKEIHLNDNKLGYVYFE